MARYIDADKLMKDIEENKRNTEHHLDGRGKQIHACEHRHFVKMVHEQPTADVAPRAEVLEAVDKFRSDLMDKFITLCRGNDYNKLTLLKIGDTVDQIYDKQIAELKKKHTEEQNK